MNLVSVSQIRLFVLAKVICRASCSTRVFCGFATRDMDKRSPSVSIFAIPICIPIRQWEKSIHFWAERCRKYALHQKKVQIKVVWN